MLASRRRDPQIMAIHRIARTGFSRKSGDGALISRKYSLVEADNVSPPARRW